MSCGFESDSPNERVEVIGDALVKAVELRASLIGELGVGSERRKQPGRQGSVDALEEFQKDEADRVAVGQESVAARVRQLVEETFGAQFREIIA